MFDNNDCNSSACGPVLEKNVHGGDVYNNNVMLDYSVNINPLGLPEGVKDALKAAAEIVDEYPDIDSRELTKKLAGKFGVKEDYIALGNGASEIFMSIVHALKPKRALVLAPSFYGYKYALEAVDAKIKYHYLKENEGFAPDDSLIDDISEDLDMIFLANPNNPTGKALEPPFLEKLLRVCKNKGVTVVLDECFVEFMKGDYTMIGKLEEFDNLIIVRAFTKLYCVPGVRLGYMFGSNLDYVNRIKRQLPEWNISVFAQKCGEACLLYERFEEMTADFVASEKEYLMKGLKNLGIKAFSSATNFILLYSDKDLYKLLLDRGILIRNCENFEGLKKGYFRIAVKSRGENEKFLKVLGECVEGN